MKINLSKRKRISFMILSLLVIALIAVLLFLKQIGYRINSPTTYTQTVNTKLSENNRYDYFRTVSHSGTIIPGLAEGAIPQGLCYVEGDEVFLYTSYHKGGAPSTIFMVGKENGRLIKTIILQDKHGKPFCGHVGGIASDGKWIWISSESSIYTIPYELVENTDDMGVILLPEGMECPVKADYVYWDGINLWVGEYNHSPFYNTDPTHTSVDSEGNEYNALVLRYAIDHSEGILTSIESALFVPDKVQSFLVKRDGSIVLSCSFWSFESSKLVCYDAIKEKDCDAVITIDGCQVSACYLNNEYLQWELEMPPMSEGVALVDDEYHILFESASRFYSWYTRDCLGYTMIVPADAL